MRYIIIPLLIILYIIWTYIFIKDIIKYGMNKCTYLFYPETNALTGLWLLIHFFLSVGGLMYVIITYW